MYIYIYIYIYTYAGDGLPDAVELGGALLQLPLEQRAGALRVLIILIFNTNIIIIIILLAIIINIISSFSVLKKSTMKCKSAILRWSIARVRFVSSVCCCMMHYTILYYTIT